MRMVFNIGINDMGFGWASADNTNRKIYNVWAGMLRRCYDQKWQERNPTYVGCEVCQRWLLLSNFVEDVKSLDNYNEWVISTRYEFDKDVKLGHCKTYSPETCSFILKEDNVRDGLSRRDMSKADMSNSVTFNKEKFSKPIIRTCIKTGEVKYYNSITEAKMDGFNNGHISSCCLGTRKQHKGYRWEYQDKEGL